MKNYILFSENLTPALKIANSILRGSFTVLDHPSPDITHLLLPVPSFDADGSIKGGRSLTELLERLPENITVIGGNLKHPALTDYRTIDLLQDAEYVAKNAAITAHCAIKLAMNKLPVILDGCPVLVIGWGRIGKCLAKLLYTLGANVTVAARKEADRAILQALGYNAVDISLLHSHLRKFRIIFNTAPAPVLHPAHCAQCRPDCLKIDLASTLGISCPETIWARGLPNKDAPESSGALIAATVFRILSKKE